MDFLPVRAPTATSLNCTDSPRPSRAAIIQAWWPQVEASIHAGITNADRRAVNRLIELEACNACGFRYQRLRSRCASIPASWRRTKPRQTSKTRFFSPRRANSAIQARSNASTTPWTSEERCRFHIYRVLIVIVILGILAAVAVFAVNGNTDSGKESAYYAQNNTFALNVGALVTAEFLRTAPADVDYVAGTGAAAASLLGVDPC
jgi:hypothetical protein